MRKILVTDETLRLIASFAIYEFHNTGTRQPDGRWLINIDDESAQVIERRRLAGETLDDTIQRIARDTRGQKPS